MFVRKKKLIALKATLAEYEHALDHVADEAPEAHPGATPCSDCQALARGAFAGVNRGDFVEMISEWESLRGRLRSIYWGLLARIGRED